MALTKDEYLTRLIDAKNADTTLSTILTSNSKAAIYYNLFVLLSEFAGDFDLTFDDFISRMDALLISKQVHNDYWWRQTCLNYQFGDTLTILANGNLAYDPLDIDNQIIKRAAVLTTEAGNITLKVAALDVDEVTPIPLSSGQEAGFFDYINDISPSGIVVTIISVAGDEINVSLTILIDGQLINVDTGALLSDSSVFPVEDAIMSYFNTFQNQDFGGVFYANKLLSSILNATGVINATFDTLEKKSSNESSFTDVLNLSGKSFGTFSGYVKLATGWVLGDNITYEVD